MILNTLKLIHLLKTNKKNTPQDDSGGKYSLPADGQLNKAMKQLVENKFSRPHVFGFL